jgi:hypothetical protein
VEATEALKPPRDLFDQFPESLGFQAQTACWAGMAGLFEPAHGLADLGATFWSGDSFDPVVKHGASLERKEALRCFSN